MRFGVTALLKTRLYAGKSELRKRHHNLGKPIFFCGNIAWPTDVEFKEAERELAKSKVVSMVCVDCDEEFEALSLNNRVGIRFCWSCVMKRARQVVGERENANL